MDGGHVACGDSHSTPLTFNLNQSFPRGIGLQVGAGTPVKFAVFCLHFHVHSFHMTHDLAPPTDLTDVTGVTSFQMQTIDPAAAAAAGIKAAAVTHVFMKTGTRIPANRVSKGTAYRRLTGDKGSFSPVYFYSHTHVITVWQRVWLSRSEDGSNVTLADGPIEIPPQRTVFPVLHQGIVAHAGDTLATECTYNNTSPHEVLIG